MLISQMQEPFKDDKWIYELKLDGGRMPCGCQFNLEAVCQQGAPLKFKKVRDAIPKHHQFTVKHCTFRYVAVLKEKYGCFVSEMLIRL